MSSSNHLTYDIKDAFYSNSPDYTTASPDYSIASPGKSYSSSSNNSFGLVTIASPTLLLFHNDPYMKVMHAYYAKESPIPAPSISPTVLPLSPVLPPPIFDPRDFFIPEELLSPQKQIHFLSSSPTHLTNCTKDCKVKVTTSTLTEEALSWWNSFALPIGIEEAYKLYWEFATLGPTMVSDSEKMMEAFIGGLPQSIEGNVTASKPQTLKETINITQRLMDQVTKHNFVQGTNNHKQKVDDNKNTDNNYPIMEFPLPGEVPTAREESCHCQKKKEATAVKIALLLKSRRNCQSKSDDSYTKLVPQVTPYNLGITVIVTSWLAQVESRLVEHKDREIKYYEKIRGLEFKTESSDEYIKILKKELDLIKKEKEGLDIKLTGFQTASKDLDSLLESQRLDKNKEGLGYNIVPPPPAQLYSPPKKDLSWTGLSEFADDTITDYSRPSPTIKSNTDDTNINYSVSETRESASIITSKPVIKFVKAAKRPTTNMVEIAKKPTVKYAELYRKTTK
nr:hypothetical protein [Tanacetum cinerariifolium]